ncbi:MAG: 4-(cytidine 5'-diphospho)-2-C-methyl-D-erythritol kinase [Caulobacterales bacterium]|jgi:4-diphosphocytidyl-2-C-methyl-D-erythritol kinase
MKVWRCLAPAKVNLYLHVGPPRADGRHPLDSLVAFADVGDVVDYAPAGCAAAAGRQAGFGWTLAGPYAAALTQALDGPIPMLAAAQGLLAAHGAPSGGVWRLDKRLPIAAGIGGGTADTAAALRLANAAAGLCLDDAALARFAAHYGADAPACIACTPVLMRDDGARLDAAPNVPNLHAVLVNPNRPCSTAAVYHAFDVAGLGAGFVETPAPEAADAAALIAALRHYRNDLEAPALQVQPVIGEVLAALRARPQTQLARLTGSGATCFALTDTFEAALALSIDLAGAFSGWWVRPVRLGVVDAAPRPV